MASELASGRRSSLATFALGLVATAFCLFGILTSSFALLQTYYWLGLLTIAVGVTTLIRVRGKPDRLPIQGCAWLGMSLAAVSFGLLVLLGGLFAYVNEAASRGAANASLKQLAIAMHMYHDQHRHLPPAAICDDNGTPLLSWRVAILPFLGEESLHRQFNLDEPWDSPNNIQLLERMPAVYRAPSMPTLAPLAHTTFFQVFVGPGTAFEAGGKLSFPGPGRRNDFPDGTHTTVLIVEGGSPVPWTKPEDLAYEPDRPLPPLGGIFSGTGKFPLTRSRGHYTQAAMVSGDILYIDLDRITEETLRRAIVRNDGKELGPDWW